MEPMNFALHDVNLTLTNAMSPARDLSFLYKHPCEGKFAPRPNAILSARVRVPDLLAHGLVILPRLETQY